MSRYRDKVREQAKYMMQFAAKKNQSPVPSIRNLNMFDYKTQ